MKRAPPPRIPNFNDEFANVELLNLSLERDIAWVLLKEKCQSWKI